MTTMFDPEATAKAFDDYRTGVSRHCEERSDEAIQDSSGKHYAFDYRGIRMDPYRIMHLYGITHPAQQHIVKKMLRAGKSVKSLKADLREAREAIDRYLEMIEEDEEQVRREYCTR